MAPIDHQARIVRLKSAGGVGSQFVIAEALLRSHQPDGATNPGTKSAPSSARSATMGGADTDLRVLGDVRRFEALDVIVGRLRRSQVVKRSTWSGFNEERCGADQGTIVDLPHEEVHDIRTAGRAESPVPGVVRTRYRPIAGLSFKRPGRTLVQSSPEDLTIHSCTSLSP